MCNDYGNHIPYSAYLEAFSETHIPVRFPVAAPNLEPRADIWPTEVAPVIRQTDEGAEFAQIRWGFPPSRPKAAPVINFRSEGRHFPKGRCLIPASYFFEFTGTKSPKSKWKFTKAGEDWTMARIRAGSSHIGAAWLSRCSMPLPHVGCALNPSNSGFAAPSISGLFPGLPEVCTNL